PCAISGTDPQDKCRHSEEGGHEYCGRNASPGIKRGDQDFESPVDVDPAAIRRAVSKWIEIGQPAVGEDPAAAAQVPPEIAVPHLVATKTERNDRKEAKDGSIGPSRRKNHVAV